MSKDNNYEQTTENGRPSPDQFYPRLEAIARRLEGIARDLADVLGQVAGRETPVSPIGGEVNVNGTLDRMLTVAEVAKRMGLSEAYVYHQAKFWPFRRKLSARALRFSQLGLEAWLEDNGRNGKDTENQVAPGVPAA